MGTIARLTLREIISKRIFFVIVLMSVAFLVLYGVATHYAGQQINSRVAENMVTLSVADAMMGQKFFAIQLLGMGLYFAAMIVSLLAILSSVGSIAGEIESHQIDTILARPLPRSQFVLGKFIGLSSMLMLYAGVMFLGIMLINRFIAHGAVAVEADVGQIVRAILLFMAQPVLLVTIALLCSSRLTTVSGGIVMIALYGISFIGGFIEQLGVIMQKTALVNIGIVSSLVFPTDSLFRQMTILLFDAGDSMFSFAALGLFGSLSTPSPAMLVYTVLYGMVALWLAVRIFGRRDV